MSGTSGGAKMDASASSATGTTAPNAAATTTTAGAVSTDMERFLRRRPGFTYLSIDIDWPANKTKALGIVLSTRIHKVIVTALKPDSHGDGKFKVLDRIVAVDTVPVSDKTVAKQLMVRNSGKFTAIVERPLTPETQAEFESTQTLPTTTGGGLSAVPAASVMLPAPVEASPNSVMSAVTMLTITPTHAPPPMPLPPDVMEILTKHRSDRFCGAFSLVPTKSIMKGKPTSTLNSTGSASAPVLVIRTQSTEISIASDVDPAKKLRPVNAPPKPPAAAPLVQQTPVAAIAQPKPPAVAVAPLVQQTPVAAIAQPKPPAVAVAPLVQQTPVATVAQPKPPAVAVAPLVQQTPVAAVAQPKPPAVAVALLVQQTPVAAVAQPKPPAVTVAPLVQQTPVAAVAQPKPPAVAVAPLVQQTPVASVAQPKPPAVVVAPLVQQMPVVAVAEPKPVVVVAPLVQQTPVSAVGTTKPPAAALPIPPTSTPVAAKPAVSLIATVAAPSTTPTPPSLPKPAQPIPTVAKAPVPGVAPPASTPSNPIK